MKHLSRRNFIKASATAAGGLMLGFQLPVSGDSHGNGVLPGEMNAWLVIDPDSNILIRIARAEMGQGVTTSLAMIVAEELEADWRNVSVEFASVSRQLSEGAPYGEMATHGSNSVRRSREMLQRVGAEARERLVKAAAEKWHVSPDECYADYGEIYHESTGNSVRYGEVAGLAAQVTVANVQIKGPDEFNFLGLPTPRLDAREKVDGSALYSMDVRRPEMVYATLIQSPVPGGRLRGTRFNAIRNLPGVLREIRLDGAVAVVAETFWQAKNAADQLPVFWDFKDLDKSFSDTMKREFFEEFSNSGEVLTKEGDIVTLMDAAAKTIESDYYFPYLAHAAMEPLNCTVELGIDRADVWVGHQDPEAAARAVAKIADMPLERVHLHNTYLGGGYGRKLETDFVEHAVRIARRVRKPVQLIYTREQDTRSGYYRPMSAMRFKAGFDISKNLTAITNHSVTHSIARDRDPAFTGVDPMSIEGLVNHPYRFPAYEFSHTSKSTHLKTGYWRSVGASINVYARECFVDEMALAAGQDPFRFRQHLLRAQPQYLNVLETLRQVSNWGKNQFPKNAAMGVAIHEMADTVCGIAAQVTVMADGSLNVDKVIAVVDCGHVVNPLTAEQQIEGGIIFGLSAALYGKLSIENGQIVEDNLDTYELIRMNEAPEVEIHWALSGGKRWGGLGEVAVPVIGPAVANALYPVTGRRIRSLPIRDYYLQVRSRR